MAGMWAAAGLLRKAIFRLAPDVVGNSINAHQLIIFYTEDPERLPSAILELVFTPPAGLVGLEEIRMEIPSHTLAALVAR